MSEKSHSVSKKKMETFFENVSVFASKRRGAFFGGEARDIKRCHPFLRDTFSVHSYKWNIRSINCHFSADEALGSAF